MVVAVISMWLFRVGLAYLFVSVMNKDVLWVWYAMFIDWICRVIVFMDAFRKKNTSLTDAGKKSPILCSLQIKSQG
jgi:Na+-driven multidrug efflux pump